MNQDKKYICQCENNKLVYAHDCQLCQSYCQTKEGVNAMNCMKTTSDIFGIDYNYYYPIIFIQIVIWILMLICCLGVLDMCHYKPGWLQPTIIIIFILWILLCWFPFIGLILFIILIIILIVFFNKCNNNKNNKVLISLDNFIRS